MLPLMSKLSHFQIQNIFTFASVWLSNSQTAGSLHLCTSVKREHKTWLIIGSCLAQESSLKCISQVTKNNLTAIPRKRLPSQLTMPPTIIRDGSWKTSCGSCRVSLAIHLKKIEICNNHSCWTPICTLRKKLCAFAAYKTTMQWWSLTAMIPSYYRS